MNNNIVNKNKTKLVNKNKVLAGVVATTMLASTFGFAGIGLSKTKLVKETIDAYSASVAISNENFENPSITSSTNLPTDASSWTAINKPETVTAGIITLDTDIVTTEKVENSYKLSSLPRQYTGMSDKQVLMINAGTSTASSGYKSSDISLSNSTGYVIKFKAYTQKGAFGSARLSGNAELEKSSNILNINTNGMWVEHKIYVKTNNLSSETVNLELWLGTSFGSKSTGAVFFDSISANSYDDASFNTLLQNDKSTKAKYKYISLESEQVEGFVMNSSFETELSENDWKISNKSNLHSASQTINGRFNIEIFNKDDTKINDDIQNTNVYGNQYALVINNLEKGHVGYESSYFTAEKNTLYKLSFLAKTGSLENGATVKLIERNPYTNQTKSDGTDNPYYYNGSSYESQTFTINDIKTTDYTSSYSNDWKEYSFYIKGNSLINTELNLEVWLGTEEADEKGYALFDNFTMQKITSNDYSSNSSNGTIANLNKYTTETDFKNGTFNLINIDSVNDSYPYTPENWTLSSKNENATIKNGIINTATLTNPVIEAINPSYPNNNVLMIGNITSNNQKYTSSSVKLSADSYSKLTIDVLTTELNAAKAGIKLVCDGDTLGEIVNIDTNGSWKSYTILIHTGYEEKEVTLQLSLGENAEGTGYALFDNIILNTSLTEENYSSLAADKKIDLVKNDWSNIPSASTGEIPGIYAPNDWDINSHEGDVGTITAGVIDSSKYGTAEGYNATEWDAPGHPTNEGTNLLMIKSVGDNYYTYQSKNSYKFESDNYYKVSVTLKTDNLSQQEDSKKTNTKNNSVYPYGASVSLDGIEAEFTGINTDSEWKTYTMYINCTKESNVKLQLSLGSENSLTSGVVYYSTTSVEKITSEEYTNGIKPLEEDSSIDNILAVGNTDVEEEQDDENKDNGGVSFNWLLVPSIITGLAILVAVVGVILRNVKRKSHKKPKIEKPYSKDNYKKLASSHKIELGQFKEQKFKLEAKQNSIAEQLNIAKQKNSPEAEKLEQEYKNIQAKLEQVEKNKQESNKRYRQKLEDLKALEKAEKLKK